IHQKTPGLAWISCLAASSSFTRTSASSLMLRFMVIGSFGASILTVGWQATVAATSTAESKLLVTRAAPESAPSTPSWGTRHHRTKHGRGQLEQPGGDRGKPVDIAGDIDVDDEGLSIAHCRVLPARAQNEMALPFRRFL